MNLSKNVKITQVLSYQSAATSSKGSSVLDMSGYEGVLFVADFSAQRISRSGTENDGRGRRF